MVLFREQGGGGRLEPGRPIRALSVLKWLGAVAGIAGALLIALNIGGTIVGIGFIFFAVSALAWVIAGWRMGELSLVAMHGVFLAINLLGLWRWMIAG